jgi:hypothetical protein
MMKGKLSRIRKLRIATHPDRGGQPGAFVDVNLAGTIVKEIENI